MRGAGHRITALPAEVVPCYAGYCAPVSSSQRCHKARRIAGLETSRLEEKPSPERPAHSLAIIMSAEMVASLHLPPQSPQPRRSIFVSAADTCETWRPYG